jgi:hypothetical protein
VCCEFEGSNNLSVYGELWSSQISSPHVKVNLARRIDRSTLPSTNVVIVGPDYFRVADDLFRMQNRMLTSCLKTLFSTRSINRDSRTGEAQFTVMDVRCTGSRSKNNGEL